ncbi:hypothetical protein SASPL_157935 [Salvia splendens]|uniref:Uncharacterized protein n=2 Tax=Salvia splendens TaxID=180675 RepID=A0A8X8VU36_SALSN|nr:hypothetical protein SASPL_157935 [Salvia splendens]
MKHVIHDSICWYAAEMDKVLENLIRMPYRSCVEGAVQAEELSRFHDWCKGMGYCGSYDSGGRAGQAAGASAGGERNFLGYYLESKGLNAMCEVIMKEQRTRLLDLPWKTPQATNDSAVFLMRHMESYKGNPDNLKAIGLHGASVRILQILRGRYCKNMLLAPFNSAKERFLSYMSHYINVTPTFRTDFARQVNGMLNKAPSNEQCNQPARKRSKMK